MNYSKKPFIKHPFQSLYMFSSAPPFTQMSNHFSRKDDCIHLFPMQGTPLAFGMKNLPFRRKSIFHAETLHCEIGYNPGSRKNN